MPWRPVAGLVLAFAVLSACASEASGQSAVIVHRDTSAVEDLSMLELRRIYLGRVTAFSDGTRIRLLQTQGPDTTFFRSVLQRSVRQVREHWISELLSGGTGTPPTDVPLNEAADRVANDRGAICFVPMPVDELAGVKILMIDGRRPSDDAYPLR